MTPPVLVVLSPLLLAVRGRAPELQLCRGGWLAVWPSTGCSCVDEESREAGLEPGA